MSYKLKDKIFSFFTSADQKLDESELIRRFNEKVAGDLDDNELKKLQNIWANLLHFDKIDVSLMPRLEAMLGIPFITLDTAKRRQIIKYIFQIYSNKGNYISYDLLFKCLGYGGAGVKKLNDEYSYQLNITNKQSLTDSEINEIIRGVNFIQPLYCTLFSINSDKLYQIFTIFVDSNGDLNYSSRLGLKLILDNNGDLYINASTTKSYGIIQGDLIKN